MNSIKKPCRIIIWLRFSLDLTSCALFSLFFGAIAPQLKKQRYIETICAMMWRAVEEPLGAVILRCTLTGFPGGSDGKESAYNTGDLGSIPRLGRSPGEGNGNPLPCSFLNNSKDGEAWWATVHGIAKSGAWLRDQHFHFHWASLPVPRLLSIAS